MVFPSAAWLSVSVRHQSLILFLVVAMFVGDGLNAIMINLGWVDFRISVVARLVAEGYFLVLLARELRHWRLFALMASLFVIFVLGSLAAMPSYSDYALVDNFVMINKMLFVFICWHTFRRYFEEPKDRALLFRLFEGVILVQSAVVMLSFAFNWEIFAPYRGARFGYAGLIPAQNEVSGFFVIAFFYYLATLAHSGRGEVGILITVVAGLMTGTRMLLALPLIFLLWIAPRMVGRRVRKSQALAAVGMLFLLVVGWLARDYLYSRVERSVTYFQYFVESRGMSPWLVLLGTRLIAVGNFVNAHLPRFGVANYLLGGHDLTQGSTETDLVDVLIRLGVIGAAVFGVAYVRLLWHAEARRASTHAWFVLVWLGLAVVSGHAVFSAINGGYLAILLLAFASVEEVAERQGVSPATSAPAP